MSDSAKCPQCGAPLTTEVPGWLCPRCLLGLGLKQPDHAAVEDAPADAREEEFRGFQIISKIGEGGCGTVYHATQTKPVRREVAIKVIKLGMDTRAVITRFESERQVLALMDHPNIARVFEAGATDRGRPFFVMEFVAGKPITTYCDDRQLSIPLRLELFLLVCEAVRHAHLKGIIHRDLKPSNILVAESDGRPVPKVIDFGVAKAMAHQRLTDQTIYTAFDQFVGTPAYMSPEQAGLSGEDIDARSDIYSLGVLLYELLTGRPPFEPERLRKAAIHEICRIIREEDPSLPSARLTTTEHHPTRSAKRLVNELRGDLDGIVMKALEKSRERRYDTAAELAADITRHLNNEPVTARPPGRLYRFRKFARRNRLLLASASTVLVALVGGLAVSSWMFLKEKHSRMRLEHRAYLSDMNAAARSAMIRLGGLAGTVELLENWKKHQPDLRGWEWYFLNNLCHQEIITIKADAGELWSVTWSPDGKRIATAGSDPLIKLWDAGTGRLLASVPGHIDAVRSVKWSPDGGMIASAGKDKTIRITNPETGISHMLERRDGATPCMAWSADSKQLATGGPDGAIRFWEPHTGKLMRTLNAGSPLNSMCWSSDGSRLYACGPDDMTAAWNLADGRQLWRFTLKGGSNVIMVASSPDDQQLAICGTQGSVSFLNTETGKNIYSFFDNQDTVLAVAWSPDGRHLASSTRGDGRIALRDISLGGSIKREFRGHLGSVRSLAWSHDGTRLASACADGTIRIWDPLGPNTSTRTLRQPDIALALSWSPDGTKLAVGTHRTHAWIRDFTRGGLPIALEEGFTPSTYAVEWSPDGSSLASGGTDGLVVHNTAARTVKWRDTTTAKYIRSIAWSPDGSRIAAASANGTLIFWHADSDKPYKTLVLPKGATGWMAWSPNGQIIATVVGTDVHLWNEKLEPIGVLSGHRESITTLEWSQDSTRLASAGGDTLVRIWDVPNRVTAHVLSGHGFPVQGLAWSPDGKRLATGSRDLSLKIWDTSTGLESCSFDKPAGIAQMIMGVAWSPDGTRIAVCDTEGIIGILDSKPASRSANTTLSSDPERDIRDSADAIRSLRTYCDAVETHAENNEDALRRLAWIRATSPYPEIRDGKKAVAFAQRSDQLAGGTNPHVLGILAAAYAEAGDFERAIATQHKAVSLLHIAGQLQAPSTFALRLYEAHRPYRDAAW